MESDETNINENSDNAGDDTQRPEPQHGPATMDYAARYEEAYFKIYNDIAMHLEMLQDKERMEAYELAIDRNRDRISGKVVLDVGCGTGILAILCANAGAKMVYAVEASNFADQADRIVEDNKVSGVVEVLHGRVEDVVIKDEVDVIISEWMGYMLLNENMLASVIIARDKWLKPGGLILPTHATLYMAPISLKNTKQFDEFINSIDFWSDDVCGVDMSALVPLAEKRAFSKPYVESIDAEDLLTPPHVVTSINCSTITSNDLELVSTDFILNAEHRGTLHGFAFWFDVSFDTSDGEKPSDVVLSTAPCWDKPTHWRQSLLYVSDRFDVEEGEPILGSVTLAQSREIRRIMRVRVEYSVGGGWPPLHVREAVLT